MGSWYMNLSDYMGGRCLWKFDSMGIWVKNKVPSSPSRHFFLEWPRIVQEGLLLVTSESMCMKFWLTACSSLPRKKVWLGELTVP